VVRPRWSWAERIRAISNERHRDQPDYPQSREFPSALWIGEEKSSRTMHGVNGAKQERDHRQRDRAAVDAENKSNAADNLPCDGHVGERGRQAEAAEVLSGPGWRENKKLRTRVGEEQEAESNAERGGGIGGGTDVNPRKPSWKSASSDYARAPPADKARSRLSWSGQPRVRLDAPL
jgi:hypothetical protein